MGIQQMNGLNNPKKGILIELKKYTTHVQNTVYKRHACYSKIEVCWKQKDE